MQKKLLCTLTVYRLFTLLIISCCTLQCSEPPPLTLRYEDRQVVDSLYNLAYEAVIDSLNLQCETIKAERLEAVTDSILKVRLVEIAQQKKRFE